MYGGLLDTAHLLQPLSLTDRHVNTLLQDLVQVPAELLLAEILLTFLVLERPAILAAVTRLATRTIKPVVTRGMHG
jgi:hypothetical protein